MLAEFRDILKVMRSYHKDMVADIKVLLSPFSKKIKIKKMYSFLVLVCPYKDCEGDCIMSTDSLPNAIVRCSMCGRKIDYRRFRVSI